MNTTDFAKYAGALIALAMCSACGGSSVAPSSAALDCGYTARAFSVNGRLVTAAHANLSALPGYPTMVPSRHAKSKTFEYITYDTKAGIFDYPKSDREIGTIANAGGGQECTNVLYGYGKETFWIVAGADQIAEYNVRKKPIKTLSVTVGNPSSCAMDTSGDLAVGILNGSGAGDIVIFPHASGSGTVYTTPLLEEYFDGYDNQGNLFADGFNDSGFELVELPKGSTKFQTIATSNTVEFPGSVQWDGRYLTVTDQETNAMYQYTVSGTKATLEGTVSLSGSSDCAQTWIATGVVFCADAGTNGAEVFKYPAGGSAIAVLTGNFGLPLGVVAAEK
ncbi:MAG: hypothetical protein WA812_02405 [Candidatus Cybelea sp.]